MRKIKLFIASSLDGYIARADGRVDWLFTDDDYGYNKFYQSVDTVIMGRSTYEQILTFGDYPYQGKKSYVISHSQDGEEDDNVMFIAADIINFIHSLRIAKGKDIWLVGGGQLIQLFLTQHLVDEIILSIHPMLLGSGISLFMPQPAETRLSLVKCKTFSSGLTQIHYKI